MPTSSMHQIIVSSLRFSKIKDFSASGFGLRRLAIVELPLQKNSSSLDSIINLVSVLLTFHELLRDNLMIIQSVDKKLAVDGCDEIIGMGIQFQHQILLDSLRILKRKLTPKTQSLK
ncbi:23129_t:CDS:2 [Gigaspora rosea]|nr:23129_t:CDS:2 [Gigaspora rosea]